MYYGKQIWNITEYFICPNKYYKYKMVILKFSKSKFNC